jgi:uncharacterized membrane protein
LRKRGGLADQAHGEAWQVHGGGFYQIVKYLVAPARLPDDLTWFKWESYATWLSGMALLAMVYYLNASLYLIDPQVLDLSPLIAIAYSLVGLAWGWIVYDLLCRSPLGRDPWILGLSGLVLLIAAAYGYTLIFSGRGAMMQIGALIGTIMVANVFLVIIPGQKRVVADLIAGRTPDPAIGVRAKQRSLHNNYLTLPVAFAMIANHYPLAFATSFNWAILGVVLMIGALIRHFFNTRHQGKQSPWWTLGVASAAALAVLFLSWAGSHLPGLGSTALRPIGQVELAAAHEVIATRCAVCHAQEPVWAGIAAPPKGVRLDTPASIDAHRSKIATWAVATHAMPPANVTDMTAEERVILARWMSQGANK